MRKNCPQGRVAEGVPKVDRIGIQPYAFDSGHAWHEAGRQQYIVVPSDMQCRKPSPALGGAITVFASQVEPRYLEVRPTGAKLWRYRYRIAGKENVFAVGEYVQVPSGETKEQTQSRRNAGRLTLAEARARREECRAPVKPGIHPAHYRQAARMEQSVRNANTFEAVAREWIAKKKPGWTAYYLRQVERFLEADVFPYVGNLPIRNVTAAHLLKIVWRVEGRSAETVALLLRQWASAIFRYAVATLRAGHRSGGGIEGRDSPTEDRASQTTIPRPDSRLREGAGRQPF
jgi:hypothetical protein